MKFHLISLGCPKNTADSEQFVSRLISRGWVWAPDPLGSDILLLNTCGFIKEAKEESLGKIMELLFLKKKRPNLRVVAFGCLLKRYYGEIKNDIPELDFVFDFATEENLLELEKRFSYKPSNIVIQPRVQSVKCSSEGELGRFFTPRHYGFLKIAEGCDNRCAYCAIPDIRGAFRSRPVEDLVLESEKMAISGVREIIVVAQDTTNFGNDIEGRCLLPELVKEVGKIKGIKWIRLQYLHPKRLKPDLIENVFSAPKVLPYFDIPIQHASTKMLKLMNRGVTKEEITQLLKIIRKQFPESVIRSTFIVGFPGEKEEDFEELTDFIEENRIDRLGAFPYSKEEKTPAASMKGNVPKNEKIRRLDELMTLQQMLIIERNHSLVGKEFTVVVDRVEGKKAFGRTFGDAPEVDNLIGLDYDKTFKPGDFISARILKAEAYDLLAERIK